MATDSQQFRAAVARVCGDLSHQQRARVLSALDGHLADRAASTEPILTDLGDPIRYARELRAALDLPEPHDSGGSEDPRHQPRHWSRRVGAGLAVAALAVVVGMAIGRVSASHGPTRPPPPNSATTTPVALVAIPTLLTKTLPQATAILDRLGLHLKVEYVPTHGTYPPGWIIGQSGADGNRVPVGSTIIVRIATNKGTPGG